MLKREPKLVVFLIIQLLISSCIPSSIVKTGNSPYSNRLPQKQALSLSDYIRTVYKVSQESTEEAEQLRRKFLDSNPEMALVAARVEANANDMESRKILAAAYLQQGLLSGAHQLYQEIRTAAGEGLDFEAELGLARIWDKWADYGLASQHADAANAIHPRSAEAYEVLGKIHLHRNAPGEAVSDFKLALQIAPETPALLANLGYAYMLTGNLKEARTAMENALALDGSLAAARNNLGIILAKMGDTSGALAQMQQVGGAPVALNNLGALLLLQKKPLEAMQAFQEALRLQPSYTRAQENLSIARAFVPPPTIVNLPPFEASGAQNKRTEVVSFLRNINEPELPSPSLEAARRLAESVRVEPGVFQGRIDPADLKALLPLSLPQALDVPLAPLQPPAEVPAFVSELLKTPALTHRSPGAVRALPLPLLKTLEPALAPPIEPPTEIPQFALELQKTGRLQNPGSRPVRALPLSVLRTAEPALMPPIEPPTEIPRFALELQKTGRAQNLGSATERALPPPVLRAPEVVVAAPVAPPTEVPRFALELQKTGRVQNLGSATGRALPTGLLNPKEPLRVEPQEAAVSAAFVPASASPEQRIEKAPSVRTPRVANQRKAVIQTHSPAVSAGAIQQPSAGEAPPAKVALQSGENETPADWSLLSNVSATHVLILLALAIMWVGLRTRAATGRSRPAHSTARRLPPPAIRVSKPIRDARAG